LSWRGGMAIWNEMFFKPGGFKPNPDKSEQWNRGAYLVEGAGHCGACHTPKNALGAAKTSDRLAGGDAGEHWYAPSLAGDKHEGLRQRSVENNMEYLKTGATRNSAAAGTMVDVIRNSTRYLDDRDLRSIAVYLKDMPPDSHGNSRNDRKWNIDRRRMISGAALYQDHCAACHMENGEGLPDVFPSLGNSSAIQAKKPDTIVHLILQGGRMAGTPARPVQFGMPAFKDKLNDGQIADLATYVRNAWGNNAPPVGSAGVKAMRKTLNR
jgi:mono/diheme cytochrome c family protein